MHRQWALVSGMMSILNYLSVLLKNFTDFAEPTTGRFRAGVMAVAAGRPVRYLTSPQTDKEELVQQLPRENGVGRGGVIAVFSTVGFAGGEDGGQALLREGETTMW